MQENNDTMWLEPTADVSDIQAIWDYALTLDGYAYTILELKRECGDLANERLSIFEKPGYGKAPSKNYGAVCFLRREGGAISG